MNEIYEYDEEDIADLVDIAELQIENEKLNKEIERLNKRIEDLNIINEEHQILNGMLRKENKRLNNIINETIDYINENWGHWCSNHCKYATETINILKGSVNDER